MCLKDALSKYQEVVNNLEFARELQKSFLAMGQEVSLELRLSDFSVSCAVMLSSREF